MTFKQQFEIDGRLVGEDDLGVSCSLGDEVGGSTVKDRNLSEFTDGVPAIVARVEGVAI